MPRIWSNSPRKMERDPSKRWQKILKHPKSNRPKQSIKNKKKKMTKRQQIKDKIRKMPSKMKKIIKKIAKFQIKKTQKHKNRLPRKRQVERSNKERKMQTQNLWLSYKKERNNKSQRKMERIKQWPKKQKENR